MSPQPFPPDTETERYRAINATVVCQGCGKALTPERPYYPTEKQVVIPVKPCQTCLLKSHNQGFNSGYQSGFADNTEALQEPEEEEEEDE